MSLLQALPSSCAMIQDRRSRSRIERLRLALCVVVGLCTVVDADQSCYTSRSEPAKQHFALVIDRSGSMAGTAMEQAIAAVTFFVEGMKDGDLAAVFAFDDEIGQLQDLTDNRGRLRRAVRGIAARGGTALNDAIAKAAQRLSRVQGMRTIIFLTDGVDTASRLSLADVHQQCVAEAVLVYGIGLGNVDGAALALLTEATGGTFEVARDASQLHQLYDRVLQTYYNDFAPRLANAGSYAIRSIPKGKEVLVDGQVVGRTPLKLDGWQQGPHLVEVLFNRGRWRCEAPAQIGQRTLIDARESDLGYSVWIGSSPYGASVFLDDTYVGVTGGGPVSTSQDDWTRRMKQDSQHLRIPLVPPGAHVLRVVPVADLEEFGVVQELAVSIDLGREETVLFADLVRGRLLGEEGVLIQRGQADLIEDAFDELDAEFRD